MPVKMVTLECEFCKESFQRLASEHKRNLAKGRSVTCSLSCSSCLRMSKVSKTTKIEMGMRLAKYCQDNKISNKAFPIEIRPFKVFLKNIRMRNAKKGICKTEITVEYLKELWESQNGICPYTGWKMTYLKSHTDKLKLTPDRASLDRIDSSKGYEKGNLQFICWMAQIAKNSYSEEDLINFCKAVTNYRGETK